MLNCTLRMNASETDQGLVPKTPCQMDTLLQVGTKQPGLTAQESSGAGLGFSYFNSDQAQLPHRKKNFCYLSPVQVLTAIAESGIPSTYP